MENESGSFGSHQKVQYKLHVVVTGWAVPAPPITFTFLVGCAPHTGWSRWHCWGGGGRANTGPIGADGDVRKQQQQHQPVV